MMRGNKGCHCAIGPRLSALGMVFLVLALSCGPVFAQAVNAGEMRGTVTDPSGAVVPGVSASILNTATGVVITVVTNEAGIYNALGLVPGNYTLTFSKEGFNKLVRQGIDLRIQVLTVNAQLTLGATTQTIEVSAQASLLKTESSEQGGTLHGDVIQRLPNIGQNWTSFTRTLPGVTGSGTDISVNGTQRYEGGFYADGGNVVLPRSNQMSSSVNFEAIQQVEVITANFNAQYGSGTAVFNQITKSGTNVFHGSLYEYDQNDFFNARSFFQTTVPRTRWNQYGGSIGGPAIKDKVFLYFNYDSTISRSVSRGFTFYPTADMRKGDFSYPGFMNSDGTPRLVYDPNSLAGGVRTAFPENKIPQAYGLDSTAKKIQDLMPLPNTTPGTLDSSYRPLPNQAGVLYSNYYYTRGSVSHPYSWLWKADYAMSGSNRLSASMMRRTAKVITSKTYHEMWPVNINDTTQIDMAAQITDVWTVSPAIVNEFRSSLIRQVVDYRPASKDKGFKQRLGIGYLLADVFPSVSVGGPIGGIGLGAGTSAVMGETTYAYTDTLTWIRGRHIIKAGGQYERNADNGADWGDIVSASYAFNPTFTTRTPGDSKSGLGYADFLTGQVASWSAKLSPVVGIRMRAGHMFIQDDFKVRPNLTLSYGLRYEIQGGWGEIGNRLASWDPTIMNPATNTLGAMWYAGDGRSTLQKTIWDTFLPRIGFAWTPKSQWSVRGAFGMFSHRWGADVYGVSAVRNPTAFYITGSDQVDAANATQPLFVLSNPNPTTVQSVPTGKLFIPSASTRTPNALNGQAVAYFPYDTPASKLYSWSFGIQRELPSGIVAEISYVGNEGTNLSFPRDFNQLPESKLGQGAAAKPYPNFQSIGGDGNRFDGKSNYHGLQSSLRKRFAKGLSLDANYTYSKNLTNIDSGGWSDRGRGGNRIYQRAYDPDINYGLSQNNVKHAFKMNAVYELPVGKGRMLLTNGGPLDLVLGGWQVSGVFIKQSGSPFMPSVSGSNNSGQLYGGQWYPNRTGDGNVWSHPDFEVSTDLWFAPTAFSVPAKNTFGNSGKNVLIGPGQTIFDFSMGKNFSLASLREGMQVQIRLDANNVLNHPCWGTPNASIGATGTGLIRSTSVGGRNLQLGARFVF